MHIGYIHDRHPYVRATKNWGSIECISPIKCICVEANRIQKKSIFLLLNVLPALTSIIVTLNAVSHLGLSA